MVYYGYLYNNYDEEYGLNRFPNNVSFFGNLAVGPGDRPQIDVPAYNAVLIIY
jgi:hypothetical protein